uniref:hypothetical protein n=1 Tax=Alistipes sp. TaxID=1872444 RepID=UPI00405742B9
MRKLMFFLGAMTMMLATSCLNGGGSSGSSSITYHGELTTTNTTTNEVSYTDNEASVTVTIPNIIEPKFDILFNGIKFAPKMPKLDIEVAGIPFTTTISEDETTINYIFDAENIIPTIGGISYKKYKIDRIWGCIGRDVEINFTMASEESQVNFVVITKLPGENE